MALTNARGRKNNWSAKAEAGKRGTGLSVADLDTDFVTEKCLRPSDGGCSIRFILRISMTRHKINAVSKGCPKKKKGGPGAATRRNLVTSEPITRGWGKTLSLNTAHVVIKLSV